MVTIGPKKIIIEIKSDEPLEESRWIKEALLTTLKHMFIVGDFDGFDISQLQNFITLIENLELESITISDDKWKQLFMEIQEKVAIRESLLAEKEQRIAELEEKIKQLSDVQND